MRTTILAALSLLLLCAPAGAADIDLVVMIDISASMDPHFGSVVDYFTRDMGPAKMSQAT